MTTDRLEDTTHASRRLETTTVAEAMTRGILTTGPDSTVAEIAATMAGHRVHCLVVEGVSRHRDGEHLAWGVVSDADLVEALAGGQDATAERLCSTEVVTVDAGASLDDAARLLVAHETGHLVAVRGGEPVGVLSTLDVARIAGS